MAGLGIHSSFEDAGICQGRLRGPHVRDCVQSSGMGARRRSGGQCRL